MFDQATTPKCLAQHLARRERLSHEASRRMEGSDAFYQIARRVDDYFSLIDLETSQLQDMVTF